MNCSALGSLCGTMCKALSMNCCNQQVIFLGQIQDEQFKAMLTNTKLNEIMLNDSGEKVITLQQQKTNIKLLKNNEQTQSTEIRLGMYELIRQRITPLNIPSECHGNGWFKLKLAGALCKIHFGRRFKQVKHFTKAELKQIDKMSEQVRKLYIPAIFLWNQGKIHGFDLEKMALMLDLSKKVRKYLEDEMVFLSITKLSEVDDFWKIDMHAQKIFYKAAQYLTKNERKSILFQNASQSIGSPHHRGVSDPFSETLFTESMQGGAVKQKTANVLSQISENKDGSERKIEPPTETAKQLKRVGSADPLIDS